MASPFRRRYVIIWLVLTTTLFLLSSKKYIVSYDGVVRSLKPLLVWEYVMDFNNMKKLNPTILDFRILSDGGEGEIWSYDISYREHLHQLPFVTNTAVASYRFIPVSEKEFHVRSIHKTCFFFNITCLYSRSEFVFREDKINPRDTYCLELVEYECPRVFSSFCHKEVMYQRKSIFENLDKFLSRE